MGKGTAEKVPVFKINRTVAPVLQNAAKVYCSFSGGADSTALLVLLSEQAEFFSFELCAVHFEHGFRGEESLADGRYCREFCEKRNIPFMQYDLHVPQQKKDGESDESSARRLRLESWQKIIRDPEKELAALGHHGDDRVENVFLRLFRGSNVSGLTSLRSVQELHGITMIRPLLGYSRKELESFLLSRGISCWRHDSTNDSSCYSRNFIRLELLPLIRKRFHFAGDGMRQSLSALSDDADCLEELAKAQFDALSDQSVLELSYMRSMHKALRIRVLTHFLHRHEALRSFLPDQNLIRRFESVLASGKSGKIPLKGVETCFLELRSNVFRIVKKGDRSPSETEETWDVFTRKECGPFVCEFLDAASVTDLKAPLTEIYLDAEKVVYPLLIRCYRAGDRLIPFGKVHSVPLKKLFADLRISGEERKKYPLLCSADGTILFAAALRQSAGCSVTSSTEKILHITFKKQ